MLLLMKAQQNNFKGVYKKNNNFCFISDSRLKQQEFFFVFFFNRKGAGKESTGLAHSFTPLRQFKILKFNKYL